MNATASTSTTRSRKRRSTASKSDDNSGDDSKKRGRPRVEKQDESAADRRRTQIRMAQRAYRQRKESTLEELRKRVSELTNTIELMNKAFVDCRDRLAASGMSDSQMQDVDEVLIQYEALMQAARNPGAEMDVQALEDDRSASNASRSATKDQSKPAEVKNVPSWMDAAVLNTIPKQSPPEEVGMGYTLYMQDSDTLSSSMEYFNDFNQESQALVPSQRQPHPNSFDAFRAEIMDIPIPASMNLPRTYSFQETTFARRLHRACLEQAYELLLDPQRRPATYDRVFKLSLMSRDRNKLIAALKVMLDKGPHESLENPAPLIHVGGAGTHYPRRDQFGVLQPKKESWNLGVVGPQTLALLENAARDNLTTDMTVDIAGFEGEWFDPYDVEGYLTERSIFIDPSSSFAEAEILVNDAPASNASTLSSMTSPKTPGGIALNREAARPFDPEQLASLSRDNATPTDWTDLSMLNLPNIGFSDADTGSWMNFLQPGEAMKSHPSNTQGLALSNTATWEGSQSNELLGDLSQSRMDLFLKPANDQQTMTRKTSVVIDVAKFVRMLIVSGVCIGRTPGFKRRDVDRALALSSFDAF